MGQAFLYGSGGTGKGGTLTVTAPAGVTVTVSKGDKTKTKTAENGIAVFKGLEAGTWTVTISSDTDTETDTVEIVTDHAKTMNFLKVYGIYRDITASSPEWAREEDAAGMSATATAGTMAGSSDFDNCYPWSGITRETLDTGDVMVKIPKFWYRRYREGNVEHIQIANIPAESFALHPAFTHSGREQDYVYVGAYTSSADSLSEAGAAPSVSILRGNLRTKARAKGDGWGLLDISTLSAIQMLYLVEFATYDSQSAVGYGLTESVGSITNTGSCDGVAGLTGIPAGTNGKVDVVWRGLEGLWGNVWEYVDGLNAYGTTCYICNDPANYADGTKTNYTTLSYKTGTTTNAYIKTHGLDEALSHLLLPTATGGSESTYITDIQKVGSGAWTMAKFGGYYARKKQCGLFALSVEDSAVNDVTGSRLLYIPQ